MRSDENWRRATSGPWMPTA